MDIIVTSGAEHLGEDLSKNSEFNIHYLGKNKDNKRYFPDGEIYISLDKLSSEKVVVLHSGSPKPNDGIVELELVLELLKERKIKEIELFITYFPYGKQDLVFKEGEINIAETLIKRWVNIYGVKKIFVVDGHFMGRDWVNKYPVENISCVDMLKNRALDQYPNIFFVAPDSGSARRNNLQGFVKKRKNSYEIEISCDKDLEKSIQGRVVGVIDDMIETGGTMVGVSQKCTELGAQKVIAIATHGVLETGVEKIKSNYDELFLTNTIKNNNANVDIRELIIKTLK